ncbi:MAG: GTPase [Planctomycetota bacterium]
MPVPGDRLVGPAGRAGLGRQARRNGRLAGRPRAPAPARAGRWGLDARGQHEAGKSTLLNAMVGAEIAQAGASRPTTRQPVIYAPSDAELGPFLADLPGEAPKVVRYRAEGGFAAGQILVDAPDTNSIALEHRQIVQALAERSDVLIAVAHRQAIVEQATISFLEAFAGMRQLLLVLGHADEVSEQGRVQLAAQLAEVARTRFGVADPQVFAVSPVQVLAGTLDADWHAFQSAALALAGRGELARIRRHNALGTVTRIGETLQPLVPGLRAELDEVRGALADARAGVVQRALDEARRRLELRRPDWEALHWETVGRAWHGPGGAALRVGGIASLGLGAGAMLARRNPLLAAGAAAGALAASKLQSAGREADLRSEGTWLPERSVVRTWYQENLLPLRLHQRRLGLAPDATAWPDADGLYQRLAAALDEALHQGIDRDLLEGAGRVARNPLRWLVDLPVYGFAVWIIYQSARGFLAEKYVGTDFLINAALLVAAWLWICRTVVRALLRRRVQGWMRSAEGRMQTALSDRLQELVAPIEHAIESQGAAIDRLQGAADRWRAALDGAGEG